MIETDLQQFLEEWRNKSSTIQVHTSGSTGKPKVLNVKKQYMTASALATAKALQLTSDDTALLCMSLQYIAGKMMVVRAETIGMKLIITEPSGLPLKKIDHIPSFAAMVPLQVYNCMEHPEECKKLQQIKNLIIGSGVISPQLEDSLKNFPNAIWSTYGMTETLSHIALRRINGPNKSLYYQAMPHVKLSSNENNCLIVDAPSILDTPIITNDVVEFKATDTFRILGRRDNIICSGGIKIQIEEVEQTLQQYITTPFAISSVEDAKLGETMVLVLTHDYLRNQAKDLCKKLLPNYHQPHHILVSKQIPTTPNGKIDRVTVKELCKELLSFH